MSHLHLSDDSFDWFAFYKFRTKFGRTYAIRTNVWANAGTRVIISFDIRTYGFRPKVIRLNAIRTSVAWANIIRTNVIKRNVVRTNITAHK